VVFFDKDKSPDPLVCLGFVVGGGDFISVEEGADFSEYFHGCGGGILSESTKGQKEKKGADAMPGARVCGKYVHGTRQVAGLVNIECCAQN